MLTTPRVARCHRSDGSSSATATLNLARRRSLRLRKTCRLSLSECAPSMRSSMVRKPMGIKQGNFTDRSTAQGLRHDFSGDALGDEALNHVAHFDVPIIRDGNA